MRPAGPEDSALTIPAQAHLGGAQKNPAPYGAGSSPEGFFNRVLP
ncbi:MAG: hypothetical protein RIR07_1059 [Bacteroidota bacterium]|jgi:hypothetical protein